MYNRQSECIAIIGSVTDTLRAQRALANAAILADVIKSDAVHSYHDCAYALSYSCTQDKNVRAILQQAGIRVKEFYKGGRK